MSSKILYFVCQKKVYHSAKASVGTSNMSSIRNSKSAQILSEEKRAVYTHCHGQASNWAVRDTTKSNPVCNYSLEIAFEICKLIDK